ncbi:MAG: hypothetical protein WCH75_23675 [Candidatus Binatia bacterium]
MQQSLEKLGELDGEKGSQDEALPSLIGRNGGTHFRTIGKRFRTGHENFAHEQFTENKKAVASD